MKKETAAPKDDCSYQENHTVLQANTQAKPRWIMSVRDLPQDRTPARYEVANEDGTTSIVDRRAL